VDFLTHSYRWGLEHLHDTNPAWRELRSVLDGITRQDIIEAQAGHVRAWVAGTKMNPPTGGQTAVNAVIHERLEACGWETQVPVIPSEDGRGVVPYWTMDFLRDRIGVEVSFNNAGVLPQNLLRMSVKAESHRLDHDQMIRLGILVVASTDLKAWSRMDSTVHTFEQVKRVLDFVTFSVPTPMVVVGIDSSTQGEPWAPTPLFPGRKPGPYRVLSEVQQNQWRRVLRYENVADGL
jgi:hypothetical protein